MSAPGRGGIIRDEEHCLDWLYARSAGIGDVAVRREWAENDRQGKPVAAREPGWWWRRVWRMTENQDILAAALCLRDARISNGGALPPIEDVAKLEERLGAELAAQVTGRKRNGERHGLWGGEQGSTTYGWMHILAHQEIAAVTTPDEPLGSFARLALSQAARLLLTCRGRDGVCRPPGKRSKRDSHPALDRWLAVALGERVSPSPVIFRPGSTNANRSLYLDHLTRRAFAGPLQGWRPSLDVRPRLVDPMLACRWPNGRTLAYCEQLSRCYDGPCPASAWGAGEREWRAVPVGADGEPIHAFYPTAPVVAIRQERELVARFQGHDGKLSPPRASEVRMPLPGGEPETVEVFG